MLNITEIPDGLRIEIKVQPRSAKNQIVGEHEGALKVKLTAPPVDGEANRSLINFLAKYLDISRKNISLLKGDIARLKLIEIRGISKADFLKKVGLDR